MKISYLAAYSLAFFSSSAALVSAGTCTCTGGTSDDDSCSFQYEITINGERDEDTCDAFCKSDAGCGKYENAKAEWTFKGCLFVLGLNQAGLCTCTGGTSDECISFTYPRYGYINSEDACDAFCKTDAGCAKYENAKAEWTFKEDCFSGSALLYSCTQHEYVAARTIKVGDAVRAMAATDGAPTCSEVYHVYQHTEKADHAYEAYAIELEGHDAALEVSSNHMVYVGESYEDRHAVRAASVTVGDRLVVLQGSSVVTGIKAVPVPDLVNVLTYEPALHVGTNEENPVIVSAYSYNEFYYHYFYATPLRAAYSAFGNRFEAVQLSAMKTAEEYVAKPFLRAVIS